MQLYCRDGVVLGTHDDTQNVPGAAYGEGVTIIHRENMEGLERLGELPEDWPADVPDMRPYKAPPAAERPPQYRRPELSAQAQLAVDGDDITGIETSVGLGAAMALDVNVFWLFFSDPQPNTNYLPIVQAPGFNADVTYPLNIDFLEVTVTDRASGGPASPTQLIVSTQRVR